MYYVYIDRQRFTTSTIVASRIEFQSSVLEVALLSTSRIKSFVRDTVCLFEVHIRPVAHDEGALHIMSILDLSMRLKSMDSPRPCPLFLLCYC